MTLRDNLEIGLKPDAAFRRDNLPPEQVRGPEVPAGPGRSPIVLAAVLDALHDEEAEGVERLEGDEAKAQVDTMLPAFTAGMLITRTPEGQLHVRPLNIRKEHSPFSGHLWFFTDRRSRKASELGNGGVSLVFQNDAGRSYLHLRGTAHLDDDRERIASLWDPVHRAWFPRGVDDPNLALLRFEALDGEFWIAGTEAEDRAGAAAAAVTGQPASTTQSGTLRFE